MNMSSLAIAVWSVGVIAWFVIRYPYARKARKTRTLRSDGWSRERVLLVGATLGLFVIPVVVLALRAPAALNYAVHPVMIAAGALVFIASLWLFRRSHKDLGRQWSASLEIRDGHQVVRGGVYKNIRHPMYASFFLWGLAQALLLPNALAALSGLFFVGVLFFARVNHEEQMLTEALGEDYRVYMSETKRIIPYVY